MLNLPTDTWRLWSRGPYGFRLEVSWPNGLATPIVVEGKSLDEMCADVRRQWMEGLRGNAN
jgi:hypothetical protein